MGPISTIRGILFSIKLRYPEVWIFFCWFFLFKGVIHQGYDCKQSISKIMTSITGVIYRCFPSQNLNLKGSIGLMTQQLNQYGGSSDRIKQGYMGMLTLNIPWLIQVL